jgi:hypothetical protein
VPKHARSQSRWRDKHTLWRSRVPSFGNRITNGALCSMVDTLLRRHAQSRPDKASRTPAITISTTRVDDGGAREKDATWPQSRSFVEDVPWTRRCMLKVMSACTATLDSAVCGRDGCVCVCVCVCAYAYVSRLVVSPRCQCHVNRQLVWQLSTCI